MKMKEYKAKHIRPGMMMRYNGGEPKVVKKVTHGAKHAFIYFPGEIQDLQYIVSLEAPVMAARKAKKYPVVKLSDNEFFFEFAEEVDVKVKEGEKFCIAVRYNKSRQLKKVKLVSVKYESYCGDPGCCSPRPVVRVIYKGKEVKLESPYQNNFN